MAQFSTIWHEVRKSIGDRRDLDTEIKSAVNDAMVDIGMMFKIRELVVKESFTTSTADGTHDLDDNVLDVITVRDSTNIQPLEKGNWYEFDSLDNANVDLVGEPTKWFVDGNSLVVYASTPDAAYTIDFRYLRRVSDMVADTDAFRLPRQWERPVKLLAKSYIFELLGQSEQAIAAYQQMTATATARNAVGYWQKINSKTATADFGAGYDQGDL